MGLDEWCPGEAGEKIMFIEEKNISLNILDSGLEGGEGSLSIIHEMNDLLSTSGNVEEVLKKALSRVLDYFGLEAGRVYLSNNGCNEFRLAAHKGLESRGLERLSFDNSFSGKAARTKSFIAQYVTELEDKKRASILLEKGFKIIICVPLIHANRVSGVMNLATGKEYPLDRKRIDLLVTIGNQIAMAIENMLLYGELERKIDTLKKKNEIIKFFAYSISHDLKSPATAIHGLAKRLKDKYSYILDEKGKEHCDQIVNAGEQIVDMVGKINTYISAGEVPYRFQKVNIREITETLRKEFSPVLRDRKIKWIEPAGFPSIVGDGQALLRVFRNLIDNALKHGGPDMMTLEIMFHENGAFYIFSFYDDGVGIREEERDRIFGKYQRTERSMGTEGSGLGLAIVKAIMERHGGRVWVDRDIQKGAAFHVSVSKTLEIDQDNIET